MQRTASPQVRMLLARRLNIFSDFTCDSHPDRQNLNLLLARTVHKGFAEKLWLRRSNPPSRSRPDFSSCHTIRRQSHYKFIYPPRPWLPECRLRNDQFVDRRHRRVLVGIERLERRCLRKLLSLPGTAQMRRANSGRVAAQQQFQGFTSLHALSSMASVGRLSAT